ncbi:integrase arm-type DNA-binding domain-containing protein [Devosia sp. A8/3-2]|nr:integrase arm-type DNA-binding domain-containing protein [Devosia sp. A8/3-2]
MARNKLTTTQIKAATKTGKIGDGDGLYLNVSKGGTKSWVFIYVRGSKRREMGLGAFDSGTAPVSLALARVKADEVRSILARGGDPLSEIGARRERAAFVTFAEVVRSFLATKDGSRRNEKHEAQWKMTLGEAYCSSLLKKSVGAITTHDVVTVLEPHWREKHETASRLRGRLEKVLGYATVRGLRSGENPARWKGHLEHLLPKPAAEQRIKRGHHAALPFSEIASFMTKLRAKSGLSSLALEFLILTASRTSEALGARWEEIDSDRAVWTVPGVRMKAGREHRVPLPARVLEILRARDKRVGLVFPGAIEGRPLSATSLVKALGAAGGTDATLHGFRSTFRDWVSEETSFPSELAEAALAHLVGDEVERAYRRGDALEKRRKLMEAWAHYGQKDSGHSVIRVLTAA